MRHLEMLLILTVFLCVLVSCSGYTPGPMSAEFDSIIPKCPNGFTEKGSHSADSVTVTGDKRVDEANAWLYERGERNRHWRRCELDDIDLDMTIVEYDTQANAGKQQSKTGYVCVSYPGQSRYSSALIANTPDNFCDAFNTSEYDAILESDIKREHYVSFTVGKFYVQYQIYEWKQPWVTSTDYDSVSTRILHGAADVTARKLQNKFGR